MKPKSLDSEHRSPVTVQMHGVRVRFSSSLEPLTAFARTHFPATEQIIDASPAVPNGAVEIEADLQWIERARPRAGYTAISSGKRRLDRDIEIGKGELSWLRIDDFLDLPIRFGLEENRLRVHGQHFFSLSRAAYRNRIKKALYWRRLPALREKRFSTILYYMVYYPAFWWLERQGIFPLHAAAVDLDGTGIILCGLPGCGKSTLSLALLSLPEARLLSDNIIFYDQERVFRCPEPVLVDERSLELIGTAGPLLDSLGRRHVYGRNWCHVPPERLAVQTIPRFLFFVSLGQQSSLRRLSYPEVAQRFTSVNWIALEMRRYLVYRSVLGLLNPECLHRQPGDEPITRALHDQGQCYELTVGWGDGVQKALDLVRALAAAVRR